MNVHDSNDFDLFFEAMMRLTWIYGTTGFDLAARISISSENAIMFHWIWFIWLVDLDSDLSSWGFIWFNWIWSGQIWLNFVCRVEVQGNQFDWNEELVGVDGFRRFQSMNLDVFLMAAIWICSLEKCCCCTRIVRKHRRECFNALHPFQFLFWPPPPSTPPPSPPPPPLPPPPA